ncbi:MAG: 16S rRNA (cytosine(1402)-N(4))-methyltransferase RsmH [Deltaproteobacteria bacterium]|jgi:16S rRNA (cytosine1402-N4)-methyltransferase|nr:16S rRNA (cytosine(1402)-N(4))-methyltransferase RsmH [Deltaproteobacteria bacterium]
MVKKAQPFPERSSQRKKPIRPFKPLPTVDPDYVDISYKPDDWSVAFGHVPVLPQEVVWNMDIKPSGFYVDLTMGGGGHSRYILSQLGQNGRLLALDKDSEPHLWAKLWGQDDKRLITIKAGFEEIKSVLADLKLGPVDAMLADLGLSSRQLFSNGRGFSVQSIEPLDMRLDPTTKVTAFEIVNSWSEEELVDLIRYRAEERSGVQIAKRIVEKRTIKPIRTTGELADLASEVLRRTGHRSRDINIATKLFMGFRLVVNQEVEALRTLLQVAPSCLKPEGRLVVISFNSLEDRQVKRCFCSLEGQKIWDNLFKKPITPSKTELASNRRARSAKMRVGRLKKVEKPKRRTEPSVKKT